jgi:hypothetical protein
MMSRLTLDPATNFYATPTEVAAWLRECFQEHDLAYAFFKVPYVLTTEVDWDRQGAVAEAVRRHTDLLLGVHRLDLDVAHVNQLAFGNPDSLLICLPRRTSTGLFWSTIAAGTRVARHVRVWKEFAAALEALTAPGVWYAAEGRAKPLHDPRVRYTAGAAALLASGVPLRGGGSTRVVKLDPGSRPRRKRPSHECESREDVAPVKRA